MNVSQVISADKTFTTVENLQSDTQYSFIVDAHNEFGFTSSEKISAKTTGEDFSKISDIMG